VFWCKTGQAAGFSYTYSNKNAVITWGEDTIIEHLKNSKNYIHGTKAIFPGMKKGERKHLIKYLKKSYQGVIDTVFFITKQMCILVLFMCITI
jgi:cytochrome c2